MSHKGRNALFVMFIGLLMILIFWPGGAAINSQAKLDFAPANLSNFTQLNNAASSSRANVSGIFQPTALQHFFNALGESRRRPVRVVHYGDSHVAADLWTGFLRERLQTAFGDGGPGYLTPNNPFSVKRRGVISDASAGWVFDGIGRREGAKDGFFGLAGLSLSAERANDTLTLQAAANHYEVFYLKRPGGGRFELSAGGRKLTAEPVSTAGSVPSAGYQTFNIAGKGLRDIELRTLDDKPVRILGFVAERPTGLVYDALGINGARLKRWQDWSNTLMADNLRQRQPDLLIISYGTNEVTDEDWTPEGYTRLLTTIVRRVQTAVPEASILLAGPPERADNELAAQRLPSLIAAQKQAAQETGVAFWSGYDATGGAGTMALWVNAKWAQPDRVHLSRLGYQRLGALLYEDLRVAYEQLRANQRRPFPAE